MLSYISAEDILSLFMSITMLVINHYLIHRRAETVLYSRLTPGSDYYTYAKRYMDTSEWISKVAMLQAIGFSIVFTIHVYGVSHILLSARDESILSTFYALEITTFLIIWIRVVSLWSIISSVLPAQNEDGRSRLTAAVKSYLSLDGFLKNCNMVLIIVQYVYWGTMLYVYIKGR